MNIPPLNPTAWSINSLYRKTHYITKKLMQSKIQKATIKKAYSQEAIIELLSKDKTKRTKIDIRILSEYLSNKYDYFKKLKENSEYSKLEKLVGVLNFEVFQPDEPIIRFGEEGDKFYILLNGKVNLYKTVYPQKLMTLSEYLTYMQNIVHVEDNQLKFERIKEKNLFLNLDMDSLMGIPPESFQNKALMNVFTEEEEKLCEFGDGFAFGEIALLKKTKRNATIKANTTSKLVSIEKSDYNKIIKELEEKRLEKELNTFKLHYPLFQTWTLNHLIRLFNCFSQETILGGELLYRQNEESNYIYIVESGKFELYSMVSLGWINEFYDYIIDAKTNLVHFVDKKKPLKDTELVETFEKAQQNAIESPCQCDPYKGSKVITSFPHEENFLEIKNEEENNHDPYNLFKVKIRILDEMDVLGIEDALEMKKRFYFVKCLSPFGVVKKVKLYDFFRLINYIKEPKSKQVIKDIIAEKKSILYRQLKIAINKKIAEQEEVLEGKINHFLNNKPNESKGEETVQNLPVHHKFFNVPKINDSKNNSSNNVNNKTDTLLCLSSAHNTESNFNIRPKLSITSGLTTPQKIQINQSILDISKVAQISKVPLLVNKKGTINLKKMSNSSSNSLSFSGIPQSNTLPTSPLLHGYESSINLQKNQLIQKPPYLCNSEQKTSNFVIFNHNRPDKHSIGTSTLPKGLNLNLCNSRNTIGCIGKNITNNSAYTMLYRRNLKSSYEILTTEIFKLTGTKRITPRKDILFQVYDDNDENVIKIESCNDTKHHKDSLSSDIKIKPKKNKSYINESILARLRCKNYKFLRNKSKLVI